MLPEDGHAPPAPLPPVLVLHHVVGAEALHAAPLLGQGGVLQVQRGGEAEVEVGAVPGEREEAP